ncbi:MAG: FecR domain-containing protein [Deltaproteobacteria bacterium]|nr:FecR domain-containing protein [Deltaproteobacteria bacterium]
MALECLSTGARLTASLAGHLSEAERLALEAHLGGCEQCRVDHASFEAVRRLRGWEPPRLSDLARERVRRAALEAARTPAVTTTMTRDSRPRRAGTLWVGLGLGGLVVAATVLTLLLLPRPRRQAAPQLSAGDITAAGDLRTADAEVTVRSTLGGVVQLGGPLVELAAGTSLRWHGAVRRVDLERGTVVVEVDPAQRLSFRVATPDFVVAVVGTRFRVDLGGVHTEHGKVRVLSRDGRTLALVGAGESWRLPTRAALPVPSALAPTPPVASPAAVPALEPTQVPGDATAATPQDGRSAAQRLEAARRALGAGDAARARSELRPLLGGGRAIAVEAHVLMAESFLTEGRYGEAIKGYRAVERGFGGTPQAESALFAIAQLESESGSAADAVRALQRYLARYPRGRFATEARQRLDRLAPRP